MSGLTELKAPSGWVTLISPIAPCILFPCQSVHSNGSVATSALTVAFFWNWNDSVDGGVSVAEKYCIGLPLRSRYLPPGRRSNDLLPPLPSYMVTLPDPSGLRNSSELSCRRSVVPFLSWTSQGPGESGVTVLPSWSLAVQLPSGLTSTSFAEEGPSTLIVDSGGRVSVGRASRCWVPS